MALYAPGSTNTSMSEYNGFLFITDIGTVGGANDAKLTQRWQAVGGIGGIEVFQNLPEMPIPVGGSPFADVATPAWVMTPIASSGTVLLADGFQRTVSSGWGTPDSGTSSGWVNTGGTAADFNVLPGTATIAGVDGSVRRSLLGLNTHDGVLTARIAWPSIPVSGTCTTLLYGNYQGTQNHLRARVVLGSDGSVVLFLETVIATVAANVYSSLTIFNNTTTPYTPGQILNVKMSLFNTNAFIGFWTDGYPELTVSSSGGGGGSFTLSTGNYGYMIGTISDATFNSWTGGDWGVGSTISAGATNPVTVPFYNIRLDNFAEQVEYAESAQPTFAFTASAAETAQDVDPNTAAFSLTASAAEVHAIPDAGTANYVITASATEVPPSSGGTDSDTAQDVKTASAVTQFNGVDSNTTAFILSASAADIATFIESATAAFVLTPSAITQFNGFDSATASFIFHAYPDFSLAPLIHDTFHRTSSSDWGTSDNGVTYIHGGGSATNQTVNTDHAQLTALSGSGATLTQIASIPNVDSRVVVQAIPTVLTSQVAGNSFVFQVRTRSDLSITGNSYEFRLLLNPAGALSVLIVREDAGVATTLATSGTWLASGAWALTDVVNFECVTYGTVLEIRAWLNSGTRPQAPTISYDTSGDATKYSSGPTFQFRMQTNGAPSADEAFWLYALDAYDISEREASLDSNTPAFVLAAGTATDIHTISDAGTVAVVNTAGGTDQWIAAESATANYVLSASASELYVPNDVGTPNWVLTPNTVSELFGKIDVGTASYVSTASATTETRTRTDLATVQQFYTSGGVEFLVYDAATAKWVFSPAAVEGLSTQEAAIVNYNIGAFASDTKQNVDSGTSALLFYTASIVELKTVQDYYLEATQRHHYDATQTHHFDSVQKNHYTVQDIGERWSLVYKGRGFLNV